jgi:pimeloyl-ACP methyl ester carboxylesterase
MCRAEPAARTEVSRRQSLPGGRRSSGAGPPGPAQPVLYLSGGSGAPTLAELPARTTDALLDVHDDVLLVLVRVDSGGVRRPTTGAPRNLLPCTGSGLRFTPRSGAVGRSAWERATAMASETKTIDITHLGGSSIGYRFGREYDASLPTLVMVNSFTTSVELYRPQFADSALNDVANLLAIEPYGHGSTRASYQQFTYWDSAVANLQVLDALGIDEAFCLGTSQGGWIVTRMAILAPDKVKGIIPLGTSMDFETQRSIDLGCWDGVAFCSPAIDALADPVDDDWVVSTDLVDLVLAEGFGDDVADDERSFWHAEYQKNYTGDEGRHMLRVCSINLRDRDGLHARLDGVKCPVLWMQGTADRVYSVANAEDEIGKFVNSADAKLTIVDGGQHFLSSTNPDDVNAAAIDFIKRWN